MVAGLLSGIDEEFSLVRALLTSGRRHRRHRPRRGTHGAELAPLFQATMTEETAWSIPQADSGP